MRNIFALLALTLFPMLALADQPQDGCYAMIEKNGDSGYGDHGIICFQGFYEEGIGQNLRVAAADSEGNKNFCGSSHEFSIVSSGSHDSKIEITLDKGMGSIVLVGDAKSGTLTLNKRSELSYVFLASQDSQKIFKQCHN